MSARRFVDPPKRRIKNALRSLVRTSGSSAPIPPGHWGLESVEGEGLSLHGLSLQALLEKWGSPLHVVDVVALKRNAQRFTLLPDGQALPCEVYYSYKTNPIPFVLSTLHRFGIGAEVISPYELWLALRLGVPPERIIYNGPVKSEESIRNAITSGIRLLTANHPEELAVFAKIAASTGKRPPIGLRVGSERGWTAQFGVPIAGGGALRAFEEAQSIRELDVCALNVHRGGMIRTESELTAFVREVLDFTDVLAKRLKLDLAMLDFGGSLATPSVAPLSRVDQRLNQTLLRDIPPPDVRSALSIERYILVLTEMVRDHYARRSRPQPGLLIEPGRALTGNTQLLLASVHGLKKDDDRIYAMLDGGINIAESLRSEYHQVFTVNRPGEASTNLYTYTVVGPICTPGDTLYPAVRLPELRVGDSLAIMDAGAYFIPFSTTFSFPRPAIVAVENGKDFLLRRNERFADLIALDELSDQGA